MKTREGRKTRGEKKCPTYTNKDILSQWIKK